MRYVNVSRPNRQKGDTILRDELFRWWSRIFEHPCTRPNGGWTQVYSVLIRGLRRWQPYNWNKKLFAAIKCIKPKLRCKDQLDVSSSQHETQVLPGKPTTNVYHIRMNAICKAMGDMDHFWKEVKKQVTSKRLNNPKGGICVQDIQGVAPLAPDPTSLSQE